MYLYSQIQFLRMVRQRNQLGLGEVKEMSKYFKYLKYVIRHKWFVMIECFKIGLYWRGIVHDLSKLLPDEFIPYARYFYGGYKLVWINDAFDKAWLLHIHRNPHHWQYWLLQTDDGPLKIIQMPTKYLKEMLCDWHGAGMAIIGKNNTIVWYLKNKDKIKLKHADHKWIEFRLGVLNNG